MTGFIRRVSWKEPVLFQFSHRHGIGWIKLGPVYAMWNWRRRRGGGAA